MITLMRKIENVFFPCSCKLKAAFERHEEASKELKKTLKNANYINISK